MKVLYPKGYLLPKYWLKLIKIKHKKSFTLFSALGGFALSFCFGLNVYAQKSDKTRITKKSTELQDTVFQLDETVVIGYGKTSRRLNTGSVASVSAKEIAQQPVTNVLSALSGRMSGVMVQTANGLPGGNISIQIRGKGSISAGTDPLYIIDGVPFGGSAIGSGEVISSQSTVGTMSPLSILNPADISSISVLKDADATAIYGSRGSNGVIIITTKRGEKGHLQGTVQVQQGLHEAASLPHMLSQATYLQIRREAFRNDGLIPTATSGTATYAPDLTVWDSTQTTDWAEYLFGSTASSTDVQASLSGGGDQSSFSAGLNYHDEGSILPGDNSYNRGGFRVSIDHRAANFQFSYSGLMDLDGQHAVNTGAQTSQDLILPPSYPLLDAAGNYNWQRAANPLAQQHARGEISQWTLNHQVNLGYQLLPGVSVQLNTGYNLRQNKQTYLYPNAALKPGKVNYAAYYQNNAQSFILEPQATYEKTFGPARLEWLVGGTYQDTRGDEQYLEANEFINESLMHDLGSAAQLPTKSNAYNRYKYLSVFTRLNFQWNSRYLVNATYRRDGSSKFGPSNRFGDFGSVGVAWLFSKESFVQSFLPFISSGKLRGSYGLTGNDQISNYAYLSTYQSDTWTYSGVATLKPTRIANADFKWESTRKAEVALELGLAKDRILLTVSRYIHRSHDQLVQYALPAISGFSGYQANLPAVVENAGWELDLRIVLLQRDRLKWSVTANLSLPRNRLLSFRNFENSAYSQTLQLGYDITRVYGYRLLGVDPQTGIAQYAGESGEVDNGNPYYYFTLGKQTPQSFGGFGSNLSWGAWSLDLFFQYTNQSAMGGLIYTAGTDNNYQIVADRWQAPGQQTRIPKASTVSDFYYSYSSGNFFDSSYLRWKNAALAYVLPGPFVKALHLAQVRVYVQGQNLLTFQHGNPPFPDPETGINALSGTNVPPLRSFIAGIQLTF